jgi:hypothetical protein
MDEPMEAQVFSLVEHEIVAPVRKSPPVREQRPVTFVPAMVRTPSLAIPNYVEHREGATEIGKLTAEAIVREYETAAKEIEGMGAHLIDCVKRCEAMTRDAFLVIEEMKETATRYREEAKRVFLQIEDCTLMTAEVRKTCTELKEKIAVPRMI